MESLEYNRIQQQGKVTTSSSFTTSSPKPSRFFLDPQNSSSESTDNTRSNFKSDFPIAKPIDTRDNQRFGFHRATSSPVLDRRSYTNSDSPEDRFDQRDVYESSPKPGVRPLTITGVSADYGVRYIGGYSAKSPENPTGSEQEQSPVKLVDYDKSPNSSRRSSEPLEVIRPRPRHAQSLKNDSERRAGDYTGDFEEELMYLPQQLQQVTQQIHRQQLSSDSNPNAPEHNTAFLLSYRRSREELANNSPNRSPVVSPYPSRRTSDPLLNCRITPGPSPSSAPRAKKTAVVSPLLDVKHSDPPRPRSVPPDLTRFDPTDPESEGFQQVQIYKCMYVYIYMIVLKEL
jgi:hypothetical protein